ncbi:Wzz/FepE/Etk N-terminal domain-containing protein [Cohaesibacter marisflavi]|uniref:Wzz/FepE/Etk N-terminal domain-containing protein n=1 Tax=Cohaesibacter marisflavi TaxID=655353 RepID=UPI0029C6E722|nr:Wzz/FepE/Etk N-terminal domain-containing protein [Cohaesibacter marisflavi]
MFGRKKKKSDLDWQPGVDPEAPDAVAASSAENKADRKAGKKARQKQDEPVSSIFHNNPPSSDVWSGLVHPRAILRFVRQQFFLICSIAVLVVLAGLTIFMMLPEKYSSTALILVDPRQPRVTNSDTGISGIGGDAAALTSYVQIMKSDGFLAKVVEELGVKDDPDYAKAQNETALIGMFRSNISAYRQGATYIVEVSAASLDKTRAAKYANGVAQAFVRDQKDYRSNANEEAAQWLSGRLTLLHSNLKKSEEAVVAYRAKNGIVDAGAQGTLDNQQLTSLVSQLGTVTTELADVKARYDQARKDGVPGSARGSQAGEFANLDQLMQEQNRLRREAAELNQTLGSRHPRILANREQQTIIAGQIRQEQARLVERAKQDYETTLAKKQALEGQLADLRQRSIMLNKAKVELDNLEREAAANRNLYEQFLARYKVTDEQAQFNFNEARIVSKAPVPIKSTKPSIKLVGVALVILGLLCGFIIALIRIAFAAPEYRGFRTEQRDADRWDAGGMAMATHGSMGGAAPLPASSATSPRFGYGQSGYTSSGVPVAAAAFAAGSMAKAKDSSKGADAPEQPASHKEGDEPSDKDPSVPEKDEVQTLKAPDVEEVSVTRPRSEDAIAAAPEDEGKTESTESQDGGLDEQGEAPARDEADMQADQEADLEAGPVVIQMPHGASSGNSDLPSGSELNDFFEALNDFVNEKGDGDKPSMLVTSTQPGNGLDITTDMITNFAVDEGFRPVVISLQEQPRLRQQMGGSVVSQQQNAKVEHFEAFDLIPFIGTAGFTDVEGLDLQLAQELSSLIDLCRETYGFVIVEAQQILTPNALEDLLDLVDCCLLVLESGELSPSEMDDWCEWSADTGVALIVDHTQS